MRAPTINPPEVVPEKPPAPRAHGRLFRGASVFLAVVCIALYVRSHNSLRRGAPLLRCEWPTRPRSGSQPYIFGASAASLLNSSGV